MVSRKSNSLTALGFAALLPAAAAPLSAQGLTASDQDAAVNAYTRAFYAESGGAGNFLVGGAPPTETDFWRMAEEIEVIEDAYDRSHDPAHRRMIGELYRGFTKVNGDDWMGNKYNDDLMWIDIVCLRAYKITGEEHYLTQAKRTFDAVWARAHDSTLGGGLWWTTDNETKNACVNGPAAIAAALLYQCGAGPEYMERAKAVLDWEIATLYHPDGQISDLITADGKLQGGATTYNQGTFIGAASLLDQATKSRDYDRYAAAAAAYTRDHCTGENAPGILRNEYRAGDGNNDCAGFKGIFTRWCWRWIQASGHTEFVPWLEHNARTVYEQRNKAGLMWGIWGKPTPNTPLEPWECSGAVALLQNLPAVPETVTTNGR